MWSTAKKFSARETAKLEPPWTVPCTPQKATVVASNLSYCTPSGHGMPNLQPQGSPYVLAKHAQIIDKDPQKSIPLFWAAINSGDRVDSALKDMAFSMKQMNRAEEAIEAIKSFRHLCSPLSQESIDNVLLELYKKCGRINDQIEMLNFKLKMLDEGLAFGGRKTKLTRYKGKRFYVSLDHEKCRLLGNLAWLHMQSENYGEAEQLYRKALAIEEDNKKQCNLAICLMKNGRLVEAKSILQSVRSALVEAFDELSLKSLKRAVKVLMELEPQGDPFGNEEDFLKEDILQGGNDQLFNIQYWWEKKPKMTEIVPEKFAFTSNLDQNEFDGISSSCYLDLASKNKSQRSVLVKERQSYHEIDTESALENDSVLIRGSGQTPDSSNLTRQRAAIQEHVYLKSREKDHVLKPKSLNRIWSTATVKSQQKSDGSLPSSRNQNWNTEPNAFINDERLTNIFETPIRISKDGHSPALSRAGTKKHDSFLTGVRAWHDLIEELRSFNISIDTAASNSTTSEVNLKTQLIRKTERKLWADMVEEEEELANQKLSMHVEATNKCIVESEICLRTQLVQKSRKRNWNGRVDVEESSNFDSRGRSWIDMPEDDRSISDAKLANGSPMQPSSPVRRALLLGFEDSDVTTID
ncbi:uncharacterized protein LOC121997423 [Zingiber officinale]|uniref:uncharacterized protein LOC121997423 n=1 Tax=Zingiber officinale TaxID=94328 RepID=UPI001C4DC94F|nr:uncharacterized protein LOC121997423 [Zingiber officinale]